MTKGPAEVNHQDKELPMRELEPNLLPLHIGSLPHTRPPAACDRVLESFPQIPTWPQLPKRSFLENMYVQFSEGFPGVVLEDQRN